MVREAAVSQKRQLHILQEVEENRQRAHLDGFDSVEDKEISVLFTYRATMMRYFFVDRILLDAENSFD